MSLLASCSSSPSGFGTYRLESDGVTATFEIPAALNDPLVQEIEKYRFELGGQVPAFYVRVTIDAHKAVEPFEAGAVDFRGRNRHRITSQPVGFLLASWSLNLDRKPTDPVSRWGQIASQPRFSGVVKPGTKTTALLAIMGSVDVLTEVRKGPAKAERIR